MSKDQFITEFVGKLSGLYNAQGEIPLSGEEGTAARAYAEGLRQGWLDSLSSLILVLLLELGKEGEV